MHHLLSIIHGQPWLITPESHRAIVDLVGRKLSGEQMVGLSDFVTERPEMSIDRDGIAHVHMQGVLGRRLTNIEKTCGACDYADLSSELARAESQARAVMIHSDTPGGMASGNYEVAAMVEALSIPSMVYANGMMASAGYMIGVGADAIVASPSASVGSIGVLIPWVDEDQMWQALGVRYNPIVATGADLKDAGHGPSLTADQRQHLQESVDYLAAQFRDHVASNRSVDDEVYRAGSYRGEQALALGLVDALGTEEEARQLLLSRVNG
jgi:signal peptide peptidase SppA